MSEKTKISWCDSTANFWEGCTKVSAGCQNCYAEARDKRFTGGKLWGHGAPRRKSKSAVAECLRWNKKPWICENCGEASAASGEKYETAFCHHCGVCDEFHHRRVFSLSLGDWLDPEVPVEWFVEMLQTVKDCDRLTFILCTKRPELWHERCLAALRWDENNNHKDAEFHAWLLAWLAGEGRKNIILLTSVENQKAADDRIPALLKIPSACRGLSLEPLLESVDVSPWLTAGGDGGLDWLIIGGESGFNARPCNVDWIRSLVAQGKAAGSAVFVKQLGARPTIAAMNYHQIADITDKKGGDISEWPQDLQVQEFPNL